MGDCDMNEREKRVSDTKSRRMNQPQYEPSPTTYNNAGNETSSTSNQSITPQTVVNLD
jgi:hypothetical protein